VNAYALDSTLAEHGGKRQNPGWLLKAQRVQQINGWQDFPQMARQELDEHVNIYKVTDCACLAIGVGIKTEVG
jgi:hypothetical protein